jgi:RHS repeat-associated protein
MLVLLVAPTSLPGKAVAQSTSSTPGAALGTNTGDAGGAFTGLATSPSIGSFTGTASTAIPIKVPPGRLAMTPNLELRYSPSQRDGAYGLGWQLALPRIARSTRHGVPRYADTDEFELNLGGRTILLEADPGSPSGYRPQVEGSFPRIGFDRGDNTWVVIETSGIKMVFGATTNSRIATPGNDDKDNATFAWLLARMEDPSGNTIDFNYETAAVGTASVGLPSSVLYGGNPSMKLAHMFRVQFFWRDLGSSRPTRISYRSGLKQVTDRRIDLIETFAENTLVRRYEFSMSEDSTGGPERLSEVRLIAYATGGGDDVQPPPTVFRYTPWTADGWPTRDDGEPNDLGIVFQMPGKFRDDGRRVDYDTFDIDGDAIVDYVTPRSDPPSYRPGNGHGFEEAREWPWPGPSQIRSTSDNGNMRTNVLDLDGDGLPDLIDGRRSSCGAPDTWCVWKNTGAGFAPTPIEWWAPHDDLRHSDGGGAEVYIDLVDLNGDGLADYVDALPYESSDPFPHWDVYWNTGHGFEREPHQFRSHRRWITRLDSTRTAYGLYDMNGDGLRDLVTADTDSVDSSADWYRQRAWIVFLNDGVGFADEEHWWQAEDGTPLPNFAAVDSNSGTGRVADLVDLNGDGLPDLLRRSLNIDQLFLDFPNHCNTQNRCNHTNTYDSAADAQTCCYNLMVFYNTGSSFTAPKPWKSMNNAVRGFYDYCPGSKVNCGEPAVWSFDLLDFDGDGLVDLLQRDQTGWRVFPHPASVTAIASSIPSGERGPPGYLLAVMNGVGASTALSWRPHGEDPSGRLPFPRWVLADLRLWDGISTSVTSATTYEYEQSFFEPREREFRGFGVVREIEPSGLQRETRFHQDSRRSGLASRVRVFGTMPTDAESPETSAQSLRLVGEDHYEWSDSDAVLLKSHSRTPYHDGVPVSALAVYHHYDHDIFGNVVVTETDTSMAATSWVHSEFEHQVLDDSAGIPLSYRVNRPTTVRTEQATDSAPLQERNFAYKTRDGKTDRITSSTCRSWTDGNCDSWSVSSIGYDGFGNVLSTTSAGRLRIGHTYGPSFIHPIETDHQELGATQFEHDLANGQLIESTDPWNITTHSEFDGLGRLARSWGPLEARDEPRLQQRWVDGDGDGTPGYSLTQRKGKAPLVMFTDGLGRTVAAKTRRQSDDGAITVVSGLKEYDANGHIRRQAQPRIAPLAELTELELDPAGSFAWTNFERDELGRMTATIAPDGSRTEFDRSAPGVTVRLEPSLLSGDGPASAVIHLFDGLDRPIHREACSESPSKSSPYECPHDTLLSQTLWFYDSLDRLVEVRNIDVEREDREAVVLISYDGLGNRSEIIDANGQTWKFEHDADGNLLRTSKPNGVEITQQWDNAGRLSAQETDGTRTEFRYSDSRRGHGKIRRATTRSNGAKVLKSFEYDELGRRTVEDRKVKLPGSRTRRLEVAFSYDDLDRVIAVTYPSSDTRDEQIAITTEYSAFGDPTSTRGPEQTYVFDIGYSAHGALRRIDFGNGLQDLFAHGEEGSGATARDAPLRCTRTAATGFPGGACEAQATALHALHYADYDDNGRLRRIDDLVSPLGTSMSMNAEFTYDALSRLIHVSDGHKRSEGFAFDSLGNIILNGDRVLQYQDFTRPYQPSHVLQQASLEEELVSFDEAGNLTARGSRSYAYDGLNRLTAIYEAGDLIENRYYDESGTLVGVDSPQQQTSRLTFAPWFEVEGNRLTRHYFLGGRKVAQDVSEAPARLTDRSQSKAPEAGVEPTTTYFHLDHQGSPVLLTNQNATIVGRPRYRAFGGRREHPRDSPPEGVLDAFNGHPQSPTTGLISMGVRDYDPDLGIFLTPDPAAQYASPYAYAGGNPVLGRDPDGQLFGLTALQIVAAVSSITAFVDHIAAGGSFGGAITAGVTAGGSVLATSNLSQAFLAPTAARLPVWAQAGASMASIGLPVRSAARGIANGDVAQTIVSITSLAASVMGAEQASIPPPGQIKQDDYASQGISFVDTPTKRTIFSEGICSTKPGCVTNFITALRESARLLFTNNVSCTTGCEAITELTKEGLAASKSVHLQCNSFGAIKCLGSLQQLAVGEGNDRVLPTTISANLTGAPILNPQRYSGVGYQANLFDPVVWAGPIYTLPFRSDVTLGKGWWVPLPLITHHPSFYRNAELRGLYKASQP